MPELIDRAVALEKMCGDCKSGYDGRCPHPFGMCREYESILQVPTIEAKPVRLGRWIPVTNGRGGHECDQCHNYAPSYQTGKEHLSNYCPNCGAKMDADHIADDSKKVGGDDNG